jgi:predicted NAD/FAD-binding protein
MANLQTVETPARIAVIGGGAAGLTAAYLVAKHPSVSVTIFESASQLGGHANTVEVSINTLSSEKEHRCTTPSADGKIAQ